MVLPNDNSLPEDQWPLDELDTHPGDPTRPPLKGHWLGGRKPTPEQAKEALRKLIEIGMRSKPGPETVQELRDEGRRH